MADHDSRTQNHPKTSYKLGGLQSFIPLNEELSTRGQRLSSLIQSRSSTSLFSLQRRDTKRRSSFHSTDDEEQGSRDEAYFSPRRRPNEWTNGEHDPKRMSLNIAAPEVLMTPQIRSMRLIGKSNPRYHWHQYYKTEEELKQMDKPLRKYYERCNYLIGQYIYIDKLLDSSLPHNLIQEYQQMGSAEHFHHNMDTIREESPRTGTPNGDVSSGSLFPPPETRIKRTPKNLYKLPNPDESSPLLPTDTEEPDPHPDIEIPFDLDEGADYNSPAVTLAIYINLAANIILLAAKTAVIVLTSSLSVLASLVDAALDFLSTAIVWTTTKLISHQDQYAYPIGRRRLEPVGVLVFSIIMITSFFQVALECFNRLLSSDHSIVELGIPAIAIMLSTVIIKGACYFYCRLIPNSSVQALAQDAKTDVVFNTFSIIFPLIGFYAKIWWLDALGGLLLSLYVIFNWSKTSSEHVRNLCGAAATADQRNVLLYLTMRFAKTIKHIQGLQAYHAGDKLNVEVDIVLDENMVGQPNPSFPLLITKPAKEKLQKLTSPM
jgi:divalent metal cation (Fe/Co/Zn/Cd) transporter